MNKFVLAAAVALGAVTALTGNAGAFSTPANIQQHVQSGSDVIRIQAASTDMRVQQLEETIRTLNGKMEDMNFQLLQMQEQMRKIQEDNEFRFQELEKGSGKQGSIERPATDPATGQPADVAATTDEQPIGEAASSDAASQTGTDTAAATTEAPKELGTIEFDANGQPIAATTDPLATEGSGDLASTTTGNDGLTSADDMYQVAYDHVLSGDYQTAEQEFRSYLDAYPESKKAADASFWMGEAQYSQGRYTDSAKTFLNAHQTYGKSAKAPEMLLKLGMSLAALDNKDTACATYREVSKRYPKASKAVISKLATEQKRLAC